MGRMAEPFPTAAAFLPLATYHPSALLRSMDRPGGDEIYDAFKDDLRLVAKKLAERK
jgi:hypothetical protein